MLKCRRVAVRAGRARGRVCNCRGFMHARLLARLLACCGVREACESASGGVYVWCVVCVFCGVWCCLWCGLFVVVLDVNGDAE